MQELYGPCDVSPTGCSRKVLNILWIFVYNVSSNVHYAHDTAFNDYQDISFVFWKQTA
jgi:hypothetical protein